MLVYLREGLRRCRDLETRVARLYERLAAAHTATPAIALAWAELAKDEHGHARTLSALLGLHADDGPLVVGLRRRLDALARALDDADCALDSGATTAQAVAIAESIEAVEVNDLFDTAIELAGTAPASHPGPIGGSACPGAEHRRSLERLRALARSPAAGDHDSGH